MAAGDIIWIAESDDLCEPDLLEKLLPVFSDPQVQLAYCASKIIDEKGEIQGDYTETEYLKSISPSRWKKTYCIPAGQEINEAFGIKNTILNISSSLFRKRNFEEGFEQTIRNMHVGGDAYLILNVIKGGKVYYEAQPLNYHRRHEASIVGKILSDKSDTQLREFFHDFYINNLYTIRNFRLIPDFFTKLENYIRELWHTLAPDKPYNEIVRYLPIDEMKKEFHQNIAIYNELIEYDHILKQIDLKISNASAEEVPYLFKDIPLNVFGLLALQKQNQYPNTQKFFPSTPVEEIQLKWTGASGEILIKQSVAFVETVIRCAKSKFCLEDLSDLKLLDFGCGWGRLIRLFYKYIPTTNLYAVDAWDTSLQYCMDSNIKANIAKIEEICTEIPFGVNFDLVISFSVFTHLSKRATEAALKALRKSIDDNGLLIITIRPFEYIRYFLNRNNVKASAEDLEKLYQEDGFVFVPHNRKPIDGDITYGDTFISVDYIKKKWRDWCLVNSQINAVDPHQRLIVLKPR